MPSESVSSTGDGSHTSLTLLGRLRRNPTDEAAWGVFVERYGRKVYAWCRQWRLQESDAEDVTQTVMLVLARQMAAFQYRPSGSFRGWLKTIAHRTWCDYLDARRRAVPGSGADAVLAQVGCDEAAADLLVHMEEECERELLEEAMDRVRLRVKPSTWEAFRLTAIEGMSGNDVGATLGMNSGAVFVARSRVQQMLQQEVRRLDQDDESG